MGDNNNKDNNDKKCPPSKPNDVSHAKEAVSTSSSESEDGSGHNTKVENEELLLKAAGEKTMAISIMSSSEEDAKDKATVAAGTSSIEAEHKSEIGAPSDTDIMSAENNLSTPALSRNGILSEESIPGAYSLSPGGGEQRLQPFHAIQLPQPLVNEDDTQEEDDGCGIELSELHGPGNEAASPDLLVSTLVTANPVGEDDIGNNNIVNIPVAHQEEEDPNVVRVNQTAKFQLEIFLLFGMIFLVGAGIVGAALGAHFGRQ